MSALYVDRDAAALAAEKIKVFAQPQRLMILSCLLRGERNVGEIAEITGIGQPALSQQLAELRRADLVQNRKEAKQVWYMLADDGVALCVRTIEAIFAGDGTAERLLPPLPSVADKGMTAQGVAGFARIL
ncbi:metalloregulator ArsR/SmtB family transcription factor [Sphingobium sp. D43FB]|uniref:ArsR/SmtB family transcription factor n=1 Tax=Sphingobium sp. D43FB TaxID=2017595 RepID=UPI000BB5483B|nr:metalloregulator ArsR/SmtB family transcription factor [Sphingobium sp. D43FB]PBN45575.1 transcriptional regulator [Sphingobium sp. D43FB]